MYDVWVVTANNYGVMVDARSALGRARAHEHLLELLDEGYDTVQLYAVSNCTVDNAIQLVAIGSKHCRLESQFMSDEHRLDRIVRNLDIDLFDLEL